MLKISNLNVFYQHFHAVKDVSIEVKPGQVVSIIGSRGAGKTTIFNTIAGFKQHTSGDLVFNLQNINDCDVITRASEFFACVPRYEGLFFNMTVKDNLTVGEFKFDKLSVKKQYEFVLETIPHLKRREFEKVFELCNGEKMLVAIGRAIMANHKLIVIDEPTLGFYPLFADKVLDIIKRLNEQGMSFLIMQTNLKRALKISNWIYVLENGEIKMEGDNDSFKKFGL